MFRCVVHHPEEELRVLAQYSQLFTRLLKKICYKVLYLYIFYTLHIYIFYTL